MSLKKQLEEALKKIESLEKEKEILVTTCLNAQTAQNRLKTIFERYPKHDQLARLVFGDLAFNTVVRGSSKYSALKKQGGQHVNKWQQRHVILNDNFLFYYSSPGDKEPKGVIRLDGTDTACAKVDLSNLKKEFTFTIKAQNAKKDKVARPFFFAASNEQECNEWIAAINVPIHSTVYT